MPILNKLISFYQRHAARKMFSAWAESYDVDVADNHYSAADRVALEALRLLGQQAPQNPSIADVGIGTGLLSQQIKEAYPCHITGLDFNADMMTLCNARDTADLLIACDAGRDVWPIMDQSSDMVVSAGLFEYLAPDMARHVFAQAFRVLKKDDFFIFTYMPRQREEKARILWRGYSGTFLIFAYMREEMEEMATAAGFTLITHTAPFAGSIYEDGSSYDYALIVLKKS